MESDLVDLAEKDVNLEPELIMDHHRPLSEVDMIPPKWEDV